MGLARRALMSMEKIISLMFFARRALTLNVYEDTWICWFTTLSYNRTLINQARCLM